LDYAARWGEEGAEIDGRAWRPSAKVLIERGLLTFQPAKRRHEFNRVFITDAGRAALEREES
jgi:hypothetical protein